LYESPSYGFNGHDFINLVVKIHTHFDINSLKKWLMAIEDLHGRDRSQKRYSNRTLDIDILLFNNEIIQLSNIVIPRAETLTQAYVLKPLVDICNGMLHPKTGISLSQHWQQLKTEKQHITQIPIQKVTEI
jgi:2-amino-4-hydroxy-6-hydroxymethyldihydropteridine diphosphokinase